MIRRLQTWLARVLPPGWVVAFAVLIYMVIEGLWLWMVEVDPRSAEQLGYLRDGYLVVLAALQGGRRVAAYHPVLKRDYREWLQRSPWMLGKPLLLGPVHIVWQDVIVVGILCAAQHTPYLPRAFVPTAFFAAYFLALALQCWATSAKYWGHFLVVWSGLIVRLAEFPVYALAAAVCGYVLAFFALRQSLRSFPWPEDSFFYRKIEPQFVSQGKRKQAQRFSWYVSDDRNPELGWPYGVIDLKDPGIQVKRLDGILASVLLGWWVYAIVSHVPNRFALSGSIQLYALLTVTAAFHRGSTYFEHYHAPISLLGRIATLRWIIRGFDRAVAPMIAILAVAVGGPLAGFYLQLPAAYYMPFCYAAVLAMALGAAPSIREWRTTGHHRIVPTMNKEQFIQH